MGVFRCVAGRSARVGAVVVALVLPLAGVSTASAAGTLAQPGGAVAPVGAVELAEAGVSGEPVVVEELTSETQLVRALPSGALQAEVSPVPVRVRTGGGSWAGVDTTLVRRADGSVGPRMTVSAMVLSGGGSEEIVRISDGAESLGLRWASALPVPELSGDTATYREVLPGVDLVVRVGVEGFSTFLIVGSREAAANPAVREVSFEIGGSGVLPTVSATGRFEARDGAGRLRFEAPVATAWDSADIPEEMRESVQALIQPPVEVDVEESAMLVSDGALVLTPDVSLLDDPETVFPVVIDPAISASRTHAYWVGIQSDGTRYVNHPTEDVRVGRVWGSPTYAARALFRFDTASFSGKQIIDAEFAHKLIHSPNNDCNAATFGPGVRVYAASAGISSSTTWANQPGIGAYSPTTNVQVHGNSAYCSGYTRLEWDVKAIVAAAGSTLTLGMISANESDQNGWRKFDNDAAAGSTFPILVVEYNSLPNTPGTPQLVGGVGSASPLWSQSATPTLRATVTDPDGAAGGAVRGDFKIYNGSTVVAEGIGSAVASGSVSSWTVPSGVLVEGVLYTVRVYGLDSLGARSAAWSSFIQFRVDLTNPDPPTIIAAPTGVQVGHGATYTLTGGPDVVALCATIESSPELCTPASGGAPTQVPTRAFTSDGTATVTLTAKDASGRSGSTTTTVPVAAVDPNHAWLLDGPDSQALGLDSWGDLDLSLVGAPSITTDRYEVPDGAITFTSPSQWAQTAGPALATGGVSFSVAAWVRLDSSGVLNPAAVSQLGSQAGAFYLGTRSGKPGFTVKTSDSSGGTVFVEGPTALPLGQWTHLAGIYAAGPAGTPGTITLYVNGGSPVSTSVPAAVFAATGPLTIGRAQAGGAPADFWAGAVDEVYTFPGVLTPAQVLQLQ